MNKLLSLLAALFLLALPTVAQETDVSEEEFRQKVDSVFEHVDLKQVETGILIEHGFNLLDPTAFNGQKPDSVYSNKDILKAIYAGLYDSRVNDYCTLESTENTFPKIDNAENISILYVAYNRFKESMFKSGDIYWENGQLDRTNKFQWWDLFDYNFCFALALGKDEFTGTDVKIPIKVDNLINNLTAKVLQIEVKADDGSYEKVQIGSDWKHSFSSLGEHWLTFRVMVSDGYIFECRTPITLNEPRGQHLTSFDKPIETYMTIAADSEQSGGELQVIYLNKEKTQGKFIRPLVIAGDINLSGLLTGGASTPIDLKTIGASGGIGSKIAELSKIYDVIYLKYNNDTDDLLRNGKLLRKALQAVNDNRFTVSDDTYVVGLGVGGVIARIGINMMESEGENHRVCKFIAVNSPFRGVNIPLALQGLIRHMQNLPYKVKKRIPEIIQRANLTEGYLQNTLLKSMVIQRLNENNECEDSQNTNWLNVNANYLIKPRNCESVSIVSLSSKKQSEKLFGVYGKYPFTGGNFKVDINGYTANSHSQIYEGITKVSIIGIGKDRKFIIKGNNTVLPIDQAYGQKISISSLKNLTSLFSINVDSPNITYVPCYSALDMSKSEFDAIKDFDNITSSKFDKCKIVYDDCTYPDYSPMMPALAYELVPHIEGQTSNVFGTTELTVANVPNISLIKYEWASNNGNFKVVSSSKNKAVLTPAKYSSSDGMIADQITVTPKVQLVSIPGIENLSVSTTATAAFISVNGNDYISPELGIYSLSQVPDDVTSVDWTASNGVELTPYEDMTVGATVQKATTNRWIQASFTSYGVTHSVRKSLKVATLDSVSMKMMKHWRNKQEGLDKYYFVVNIYPNTTPTDEMSFCWYNTVTVNNPNESSSGGTIGKPIIGGGTISLDGKATIKTEGDVGACRFRHDFPITDPIKPIFPQAINDLPDIPVEPALTGKNQAIVSMPKIGVDEVAEGDVYCDVKDKFGTKYTVHYPVESHYAVIYSVAPNPADAVITITKVVDGEENGVSTYGLGSAIARLYSEQTLVREQAMGGGNCRMNVGDLPDGTYFLVVTEDGETMMRQTVIIKH